LSANLLACSEPSLALEHGLSGATADLGGFDHSNIVEDHVQRLEQLATVRHHRVETPFNYVRTTAVCDGSAKLLSSLMVSQTVLGPDN
jgi:hypothetical protein